MAGWRLSAVLLVVALSGTACAPVNLEVAPLPLWQDEFSRLERKEWRLSAEQIEVRTALQRAEAALLAVREEWSRLQVAATACPARLIGPAAQGSPRLRGSVRAGLLELPLAPSGSGPLASVERTLFEALAGLDRAEGDLVASSTDESRCSAARQALHQVRAAVGEAARGEREAALAVTLPGELWPALLRDEARRQAGP